MTESLPGVGGGAETPPRNGGPGASGVSLRWLGVAGWEITFGRTTILFDPWLSRINAGLFSGNFRAGAPAPAELWSGNFDPSTPATIETALVDRHIGRADAILIGHGHYDHIGDVPHIARRTGATVLGSESHINMLRAYGLDEGQLVPCQGGEVLQFEGFTIEVIPALHSLGPNKKIPLPGRFTSVPPIPRTVGEMVEGGTFVYMLTVGERFGIFLMSTHNFQERAVAGLKPDVALFGPYGAQTYRYTERLLRALNYPRYVLPNHWDNFEWPATEPLQDLRSVLGEDGNLDLIVGEVKRVSPKSRVLVMQYFESFAP